jgi:hypothetical protein
MTREEAISICTTCENARTCQASMCKRLETTFPKQWNEMCAYLRKKWRLDEAKKDVEV